MQEKNVPDRATDRISTLMTSTKPIDIRTMREALEAGARNDDLDEACLGVQEILGVEDGGLASMVFSDLDQGTGPDSWAALSVSDRHDRLNGTYAARRR